MEVKSITIGGFRNLERTKIEVKAITALVSLNNYGKTNFLKGIEFAVAFITKGEFEREKMMGLIHSIPLNPSLSNEPFVFEIEFHEPKLKEYQFIRYGFSFKWKRNGDSGQRLVDEWLDLRESESTKYTSYLKREELKYRKSKSTTAFRNIILNEYQLALDNLSSIDDLDYLEVIKLIKRFSLSCMENSYQENNSVNSKMFYDLKKSDPNKFDLFREAILTIFDDVVDIDVVKTEFEPKSYKFYSSVVSDWKEQSVPFKLDNESYKIFLINKNINQPIEFNMLSKGSRRLFSILATIFINSSANHLIVVEELASNIHPSLIKRVLQIIYENIGEGKLIFTTYNPYLIQYLKLENIYIGLPNNQGKATFKNILKSKERTLINSAKDNGLSVGEYLFDLMGNNSKTTFVLKSLMGI
ncbi:MAG: AAA family ATPase [Sphaerochaetaceae bacterium]